MATSDASWKPALRGRLPPATPHLDVVVSSLDPTEDISDLTVATNVTKWHQAVERYCESTMCRVRILATYFGDQAPPPCGRCDRCRRGAHTARPRVAHPNRCEGASVGARRGTSVLVLVMDVRVVRMRVTHRPMDMPMRMRRPRRPRRGLPGFFDESGAGAVIGEAPAG